MNCHCHLQHFHVPLAAALSYVGTTPRKKKHVQRPYVGVHGTTKNAREFLEGKKQRTPVASSFGAIVLRELPDSVTEHRKNELPRFQEGVYLHAFFECIVLSDGESRRIRPEASS